MALKDWKKTNYPNWVKGIKYMEKEGPIITKYGHPPRPRKHILIESPEERPIVTKKWRVDITENFGKSIVDEEFNTKSQALKYAREYMRKH